VDGDRTLCRELPHGVAMNAEVRGRVASVEPFARIVAARRGSLHQAIDDEIRYAAQDLIDQRQLWLSRWRLAD
jgi:hypothetical protein